MKNSLLISYKIPYFITRIFKFDNYDWLKNHDFTFVTNRNDVLNSFIFKLKIKKNFILNKTFRFLRLFIKSLFKGFYKIIYVGNVFENKINKQLTHNIVKKPLDNRTKSVVKNYNGFYTKRTFEEFEPEDEKGKREKIIELFQKYFASGKTEMEENSNRNNRMYKGNSLK